MGYLGNQITTVFPTSISVDSATISGNTTVGGTLGVTGAVNTGTSLTVANGLTLSDGNMTLASGHGIDFSATDNSSGSMVSELLNDYERGTFNVAINSGATGGSYANTGGNYVKIGDMVTFTIRLQPGSFTGNSDGYNLSGLPFTSATGVRQGRAFFNYRGNFEDPMPTLHIGEGSTLISFFTQSGSGLAGNTINNLNVTIHIQGFYYTA